MGLFGKLFGKSEKPPQELPERKTPAFSRGSGNTFQVADVYNIKGVGIVVVGHVQNGTVFEGQTASVNGKPAKVRSIESHHQRLPQAMVGQDVGISLEGIDRTDVKKGDVLVFA